MTETELQQSNNARGLRRLMLLRVVVVTVLLGIAAVIQIKGKISPSAGVPVVFAVIIVTYLLSLLYILILKAVKVIKINVYIQALCDILLITLLVYVTGGITSVYSALYNLVIIYASLFLAKRGGLFAASASSVFYGLLLDFQYYGVLPLYGALTDYTFDAAYVLSRLFIHIVSYFIVAVLVSFIAEKEKKSRSLLTEKESEFDQLDFLYKSIIENVNAGIVTIDHAGKIKSFNRAAEEITGFLFTDIEGNWIESIFPGFYEALENIERQKEGGEAIPRAEIVVDGKERKDIHLGFSVSPLNDASDNMIGSVVIFQDLTATKLMEKEIEKSKNLALIGEMAAGLAHEIRNPLTALSGSIQLLKRNLDLDETDARLMQIILRGRDQLEKLISNFLLLARPNPGDREKLDITNIISDVIESIKYDPSWHDNIRMERELCDDSTVFGNRTEVKQMIWNLILNAIQAMPGGGTLKLATKTSTTSKKKHLEVLISDTGCGIEKDTANKIFTPFFTTKERGTGLGLAIANRIAGSHRGEIKIESGAGKGTICKVILPIG
ncbi:Signal transduction histidine kinase [uncultured Desulfobacterium sp.]|uniref:histidine kinase n=1 Tax=uncultured Desulfobacterium sp. TaxID=201089 RepID=A0A445MXH2_9BACT|nr:Signal transduction histidine kinase [uncultured Desulfobacterium sp.]